MLTFTFDPFPIITTERLVLRDVRHSDRDDLFLIRSDEETMKYIPRPIAKTPEDITPVIQMVQDFVTANERINWAITEKGSDKLIGMIGYVRVLPDSHRAEIGYVLNKAYHRTGIMMEALKAVMDYGFEGMKLHSVEAVINPENTASCRLVEKYGFTKDAYFRDYINHNDRFVDAVVYSFLKNKG
ncbi:MAG: alanine acetyltransferase [Bacteroidetes bacterium 43-93]|nr:GNAT family N-acetyltransferase [Bacteroidota bacterium]OJX00078.1 MAG: alanine acetyltransferase [Bacteroidetes bacterium 43-93]